ARRVGSASATKTCSATDSMSGAIEVVRQFGQLPRPTLAVRLVGVAASVERQLGEACLDDPQHGAGLFGLESELDVRATWVVVGQVRQAPGVGEHGRLLDAFD